MSDRGRLPTSPPRAGPGGLRADDSALDTHENSPVRPSASQPFAHTHPSQTQSPGQKRRPSARMSFASVVRHRPSFVQRWRAGAGVDEESGVEPGAKPAAIPSALQEVYSAPLPVLSMMVLSIVSRGCLFCARARRLMWCVDDVGRVSVGERVGAVSVVYGGGCVASLFLSVQRWLTRAWCAGFHQFENEADVGYWTGILGSFTAQSVSGVSRADRLAFGSFDILPHAVSYITTLGTLHHSSDLYSCLTSSSFRPLSPRSTDRGLSSPSRSSEAQ